MSTDPAKALASQLRNIEARSGRTIAELHDAVRGSGLARHGERRGFLMERFGLGYGDANTVVHTLDKPTPGLAPAAESAGTPAAPAGDPLDAIYAGAKAALRPLHEALMARLRAFGAFDEAPKKAYVSLRRRKQFAMVGPATREAIEIGLAVALPPHPRLVPQPAGAMCRTTTRIRSAAEIDAELLGWLRSSYDAAG